MRRRWSSQSRLLMGLAVLLAFATFVLVRGWAARIERLAPGERVPAWVATHALEPGAVLASSDLRVERIPSTWVPENAASVSRLLGRRVVGSVGAGEILTTARIAAAAGPVAAQIPQGLRAVVVPSGLPAGVVAAGDRVDVLATYGGGQPYTDTVGEALEVLQVLPAGSDPAEGMGLVLLADPSGAEALPPACAFAQVRVAIVGAAG